jgi:aquaporin Z
MSSNKWRFKNMESIFGRARIAAVLAEFLGTGVLTLMFLSVKNSQIGVAFFVALAAGLTVALMMLAVGRNSGAQLNPALTLGLWSARRMATVPALLAVGAQLLGAWAAYGLFTYVVNTSLPNPHAHYTARTLVTEAVGTGILAFGWSAAIFQAYNRGLAAATAGLSYVVGLISVSVVAVAYLNPAVALGARSWVWGSYVVGPLLGAVVGANLYGLLFAGVTAVEPTAEVSATNATTTSSTTKKSSSRRKSSRKK